MTNEVTEDKIEAFHFAGCLYSLLFVGSAMGEAECKSSQRGSGYWELLKNQQDYIFFSHALPSVLYSTNLSFTPSRETAAALGRWDRKLCQFLLCSCPAVGDLSQLLVTRSLGISAICLHVPP